MKRVELLIDGEKHVFHKIDAGARYTDKAYVQLSSRLNDVYQEAANDLYMKQQSWYHAHEARVRKYQAQVENGEITQADFNAWMQGQLFQEEAWKKKREQLARTMVETDKRAMQMVNRGKMDVFAENANFMGWQLENGGGADFGFGLYDQNTVTRLIRDEPNLLPMPRIDEEKDFAWYNGIINRAVTQGILQGEDLDDIAMRISLESGEKSLSAIRRNARTAYTGAQNAGRVEGMRQAQALGIKVKKRWMATLDAHTRDAHDDLDGQTAEVDEPFESILGPIMYPGDPDADPKNVYNCRCTLAYEHPEYPSQIERVDDSGENVGAITYKEWREMKERENGGG